MITRTIGTINMLIACCWFGSNWNMTGDERITTIAVSVFFMLAGCYLQLADINESIRKKER